MIEALKFFNSIRKRRAVVFLVSDFILPSSCPRDEFEKIVRATAGRHDRVSICVSDPAEMEIPDVGLVELEDPETGEITIADTSSASVRKSFSDAAAREKSDIERFFVKTAVDSISLSTDKPYIDEVRKLFRRRAYKRR